VNADNLPTTMGAVRATSVFGYPSWRGVDTTQQIIWLCSYPKSGNTWLRAFIHNILRELGGGTGPQDINQMSEHTVWELEAENFERALRKPLIRMSPREIAKIRPEVQRHLANAKPGPFFVKTHLAVGHDFQYPTINRSATLAAIHIVRNPLDVAISFANYFNTNLDSAIEVMGTTDFKSSTNERTACEFMGSWSQNVASWIALTERPVFIIRYEDMLSNPARSFAQLLRFLRLPASAAQLNAAIANSSFAELSRQERENGFNERPGTAQKFFRDGRAGQWHDVLSRAQIQLIVRTHAPMMQRFGYLAPDCGLPIR
jgi:hypothetical protein